MTDISNRIRTKNEATGMRVVAQYVQEFYDERLEKWTENRRGYFDFVMNPSMQSFGHQNVSCGYNVDSNTLVFQGEVLDLNVILNALKEIKAKCDK